MWELLQDRPDPVEVTVPGGDRRHPGILIHRPQVLDADEIRRHRGLPVTAPVRTVIDLASELGATELERITAEAERRKLLRREGLRSALELTGNRRGTRVLRSVLAEGPAFTRSEAERRFLSLLRQARLPLPRMNARIGEFEVDFLWTTQRLVIEVDGFAFHSSRKAFENDRLRDAELLRRGFRVMRITWHQLVDDRHALVARVAQTLAVA